MIDSRNIRYFLMQHELNPSSKYFLPLADLYINAGRLEEADQLLDSGLELHPESVPAQLLLGICRQAQGRLDEAADLFEKVASKDPHNSRIPDPSAPQMPRPAESVAEAEAPEAAAEASEDTELTELTDDVFEDVTVAVPGPESVETEPVAAPLPDESLPASEPLAEPQAAVTAPAPQVVPTQFLTSTLADIYLAQNHREKALKILYQVLAEHPERDDIAARITEIEAAMTEPELPVAKDPAPSAGVEKDVPDTRAAFDEWMRKEMES